MNADLTGELAVFLRTRRERLSPEQVDLPPRRRARRTPGLRREEVAELAGVSVDYVVRLEQGRGLNPSPEVLRALAGALRLSADEEAYLFALAGERAPERRRDGAGDTGTARLVHDLSPLPAMLVDHRFDILAWNAEMAALMTDFGALPPERRNTIELCLFDPAFRTFYADRERVIREGIADLRAAWARRPHDARLGEMIGAWCARSEEFAALWESRDVRVNGRGRKRLVHPVVGALTIDYEVLSPLPDPQQRLVVYRAADAASEDALTRLRSGAPGSTAASAPGEELSTRARHG